MDPKTRNKIHCNITDEEKTALKTLIKLQKERQIVVKPCDKGAGIILLDFEENVSACIKHLEAKTDTGENYYREVGNDIMEEAKQKIINIIEEAFDNETISKDEYEAMMPPKDEAPVPGCFYCTFKVHKKYEQGTAPPPRGLVSCSGTLTENIAIFVDHHIKELGQEHETYLQDTPDF